MVSVRATKEPSPVQLVDECSNLNEKLNYIPVRCQCQLIFGCWLSWAQQSRWNPQESATSPHTHQDPSGWWQTSMKWGFSHLHVCRRYALRLSHAYTIVYQEILAYWSNQEKFSLEQLCTRVFVGLCRSISDNSFHPVQKHAGMQWASDRSVLFTEQAIVGALGNLLARTTTYK